MIYLIHAFPLGTSMFDELERYVEFDVTKITLPGFDGVGLPNTEPDLGIVAQFAALQIDKTSRVILGGCSLGGYVIMEMLRQKLVKPERILLMDTKHTADTDEAVTNRLKIALNADRGIVDVEALSLPLLGSQSGHLIAPVQDLIRKTPASTIAWTQRAMAKRPDSSEVLANFSKPALVVVGEEDRLAPVPVAQEMADLLSLSTIAVVPEAGHLAPWEKPREVAAAISVWMAS